MQGVSDAYENAVEFLKARSADRIPHVKGTLLSHLKGTFEILQEWGNPQAVCVAGLCHAVYGTHGFEERLLETEQRSRLRELIGTEAEELVYFYASCDRPFVYPQVGTSSRLRFRDRFTKSEFEPDDQLFRSFMELTFANELEIVRADPSCVEPTRATIVQLFERCRGFVSPAAFAYFQSVYGPVH